MIRAKTTFLSACLLLVCAFSAPLAVAKTSVTRRVALIVSTNDGGRGRAKLRFANKDADAFATVLKDLGGVAAEDAIIVENASRHDLDQGFALLRRRLAEASAKGERPEAIFYYSGHSNEDGLLLGDDIYKYPDLKAATSALPVEVRIVVLDSCASGHLTASKGGVRRPAFLLDASSQAQGHAFITSSSSNEAAQESAGISGSFFTHYLVSGLRGAADINADGRVTLNEAYQYAYAETLARTETTLAGAQHPAYDFKLAGTGDLTLTDVRESSASLRLGTKDTGRFFVRNEAGALVAEINKPAGRKMELGLEPGSYRLVWQKDKQSYASSFALAAGDRVATSDLHYASVAGEANPTRGDEDYKLVKFKFSLLPPIFGYDEGGGDELHYFALDLIGGHSGKLDGMSLSLFGHVVEGGASGFMLTTGVNFDRSYMHGVQMSAIGNYAAGETTGWQVTSIANYAGSLTGLQTASVLNYADGPVSGSQLAGVVNIAQGDVVGVQAAGGVNYAAGNFTGAQLGVVNVTGNKIDGAEIGIVNYAKSVKGLQLGIVNYADDVDGAPIGLVSFVKNGRRDVDLWADELGFTHFSFKMGSKYVYTLYDVATRSGKGKQVRQSAGIGLGVIYPRGDFYAALESFGSSVLHERDKKEDQEKNDDDKDDTSFIARTQLAVGYRVVGALSVYAGPSFSFTNRSGAEFDDEVAPRFSRFTKHSSDRTTWFGAHAGVKYEL